MGVRSLRCLVGGHLYRKSYFPDDDRPGRFLLRCRRCGHERDAPGPDASSPHGYAWDVNPF